MSEKNDKELYLNFDEYIRQGEPQKKERAEAWRVAIGLQAVDGLKVSGYLLELARRNIEAKPLFTSIMANIAWSESFFLKNVLISDRTR